MTNTQGDHGFDNNKRKIIALLELCEHYQARIKNLEIYLDQLSTAYDNTILASYQRTSSVKKWWKGAPPAECVGRCDIQGFLYDMCVVCKWQEPYLPPQNPEY